MLHQALGPFPEIYDYLIAENMQSHISISDNNKYLFKFAYLIFANYACAEFIFYFYLSVLQSLFSL